MILTADIGGANIKTGLFDSRGACLHSFKMGTDVKRTGDEYISILLQLMTHAGFDKHSVTGIAVSSDVPQLNETFHNALIHAFGIAPVFVGSDTKTGLVGKFDAVKEFGSGTIVSCVAAAKLYGAPFILVDFGTKTKISVVNGQGEFYGGLATLGILSTLESMGFHAANLSEATIRIPQNAVAQNAFQSIQSGVVLGAVGQTKYLVERIKQELHLCGVKVIATGGLSDVANVEPVFDVIDRQLSLKGLFEIARLNS